MKNVLFFLVCVCIGAGVFYGYIKQNKQENTPKPVTKKQSTSPSFSIETPPSQSLKGTISSRSGTLFWESRIATSPGELKKDVELEQGEELITKDKSSATVNFDSVGSMTLSENADLAFNQTLPVDFVVEQKTGTVDYLINGSTPLSVRMRNALITKLNGKIQITITEDDPVIVIKTIQGTAQIGFNDLNYVSQVFTLREGQVYEYNSDEHTAINTKNK